MQSKVSTHLPLTNSLYLMRMYDALRDESKSPLQQPHFINND